MLLPEEISSRWSCCHLFAGRQGELLSQRLFAFPEGQRGRRGAVPAVHSGGSSVGNTWEGEGLHCLYLSLEPCAHDLSAGYGKCWLLACIMQGSANCNAHLGKYRGGKVERGPARPFLQCLWGRHLGEINSCWCERSGKANFIIRIH